MSLHQTQGGSDSQELVKLAEDIRKQAERAPNEATIASIFETKLYELVKRLHSVELNLAKEELISTNRHVAKGRMDARIGSLVIEYKKKLSTQSLKNAAVLQIKNYLENLPDSLKHGAVGVLTNGQLIKFISYDDNSSFTETAFEKLSGEHLKRIVRNVLSLDKKALTPSNLIAEFCEGDTSSAKKLAQALYKALDDNLTDRSNMLFCEWQAIFHLAHDDFSKQKSIEERRSALAEALKIKIGDNETEYKALYAIQTSYAIIVKVIAFKVLASIRNIDGTSVFNKLAEWEGTAIRSYLDRLESGDIFRQEGFGNLLEGDFFAWYCTNDQWDDDIADAVKCVFSVLAEYEDHHMFDGGHVQDLFKDLYMAIIPGKVRHNLGEFYTPPWLAEQTILEALGTNSPGRWTALDPCCGSGTFITLLIRLVLEQSKSMSDKDKLRNVLARVKGIDLNPLAVLTSRINYFINLSHLIGEDDEFDVPIYLGDASYVPELKKIGKVQCLEYVISTKKGPLNLVLPKSAVTNPEFAKTMTELEASIKNEDKQAVVRGLCQIIKKSDQTQKVGEEIDKLAEELVNLQRNNWNGIWPRIISNFLITANLGRFDIIVGNPPWIDWKNLPEGYRGRIKQLCIDRRLFSGDRLTGGINLNVCALIANVAAQNWLKDDGTIGFLMPENLIFEQSYEGFRNFYLNAARRLYFQRFVDWNKTGKPFAPAGHRFLGFFISNSERDYSKGVPVIRFEKKPNDKRNNILPLKNYAHCQRFSCIKHIFDRTEAIALTTGSTSTAFSYAADYEQAQNFSLVSGECPYPGREGVEVFPQELFLLEFIKMDRGYARVQNYQGSRSKHKVAFGTFLIETDMLYPLVKGTDIKRFHIEPSQYVVPFPYDDNNRFPIKRDVLNEKAPKLMNYFNSNRETLEAQTKYSDKIIGQNNEPEFYALARVGTYSYGEYFVAFRDNTTWQATVVSNLPVPWPGKKKRPVFQNHAVSISQRANDEFITEDEAHYICAIFNAPIVAQFILQSSDSRTFKIRPPINVPSFDCNNKTHMELACLSREAHAKYDDAKYMDELGKKLDGTYLGLLNSLSSSN